MRPTTSGRFRVLESPRDDEEWLFLDTDEMTPTYVSRTGHGDREETVTGLAPGYLVEATIEWTGSTPVLAALEVVRPTLLSFVDGASPLFEAARETWEASLRADEPMNSRVTRDTDGAVNGVCYTFAAQPGARDLFAEFQNGSRPLEPLIDRLNEGATGDNAAGADPDPREVFVVRPLEHDCVVVLITLRKGGLLADTVRDTYDCQRPEEPLVDGEDGP